MKRNYKIFAFVIVLTMLTSMVTIPVSALGTGYVADPGVNLLPIFGYGPYNYESTDNDATAETVYGFTGTQKSRTIGEGFYAGAAVSNDNSVITDGAGPDGSKAAVKTIPWQTAAGVAKAADGPQLTWIPLEPNAIYEVSVDIKINSDTPKTANIYKMYTTKDTTNSDVVPEDSTGTLISKAVTSTGFSTVSGWFSTIENAGNGTRCHTHVAFAFNDTTVTSITVDNWSVKKVAELNITGKQDNGDATATYTFNNTLGDVTEADFLVDAIQGKNAPTLSVAKSGNTCTVTLSNYSNDTEYTLRAKPQIEDIYGQVLSTGASRAVKVTTPASLAPPTPPTPSSDNIVEQNSYDGTFENATSNASYGINRGGTNVTLNVRENAEVAYRGSKYLEIVKNNPTATAANSTIAFILNSGLTAGKTYVVSYYVKTSEGSNTIKTFPQAVNNSSLTPGNAAGDYVQISNEWTKVTDYFTADATTATDNNKVEMRIVVRNNGTVYVDNFAIYEMEALANASYFARITKAADSVEVEITNKTSTAPELYCVAVKCDETGLLVDLKLGIYTGISTLNNKTSTYLISEVDDTYRLFIMTKSFNPLNASISL